MAKKILGWTKEKYARFMKEGRGQGEGANYIPWTLTHEFPSKGRATRLMGIKTNRIHHLHSDNQLRAFLIFEASDKVIDIRESVPLLDIMEVIDDRENLRLDKFCDKETSEQLVVTTSFLLTINSNGNKEYIARSVKNSSELTKKITFEKLEIERRYWSAKGIDWKIITDKELPKQYCKNIEWVRETLLNNDEKHTDIDVENLAYSLYGYVLNNKEIILKDLLKEFELREQLDSGTGLYLFRYLIGKRMLRVNMRNKINISLRAGEVVLI
jgi:hypothetical protein